MVDKIFFQSSMPRAGSTLLQSILNLNPEIYAGVTDGSLELLFGARGNFSNSPEFKAQDAELMKRAFSGFCLEGLTGYCNALIEGTGKKNVVLKSRGWGINRGFIETFYPNPKIICCVRSLKDIVSSYEKIYRNNQHLHDPVKDDSAARGTTTPKRVDEWIHPQNTIGRALERIFEIINQKYDDKILFVKYEDLCLRPESEMVRIYDYLELPYYSHDFDNIEQTVVEDDSAYNMGEGLHIIRPKLEMKYSDADHILGNNINKWLFDTYQWYYNKFGYKK